jgi:Protein of unknown function (DUF4058)
MATRPPFPGMDPYLERPNTWPEFHAGFIGVLMRTLNLQITPKYRAAIEQRVYIDALTVIVPDTTISKSGAIAPRSKTSSNTITATITKPERVNLPIDEDVNERFLEIRDPATGRVITVVELLSPKNKRHGKGRSLYLEKRRKILESSSHFVEIDLLREGESMPLNSQNLTSYQILVSRAEDRPMADRYGFNLRDSMPCFTLPLDSEEVEPVINLKALMEQTYQEAALDLSIDYSQQPMPEVTAADWDWMRSL